MSFSVIIPARFASQRLPGKPLRDIAGKSMIQRVYECAKGSAAQRVIVATDDARIAEAVKAFDGEVCLTSAEHPSGTDRLQEVVSVLKLKESEIVVNVQGDEPLIPASVINQVAKNLKDNTQASCATLCEPIQENKDFFNPNIVKVVSSNNGMALYFSRAPIPWNRESFTHAHKASANSPAATSEGFRHIGIYAYRVSLLHKFVQWPAAALENIEKLEQLRILANGHQVHVACADEVVPGGVDTVEDLQRLNHLLQQ